MDQIAEIIGGGVLLTGARGNFSISFSGQGGNLELLRLLRWRTALRAAQQTHAVHGRPIWKSLGSGLLPATWMQQLRRHNLPESLIVPSLTTVDFRQEHYLIESRLLQHGSKRKVFEGVDRREHALVSRSTGNVGVRIAQSNQRPSTAGIALVISPFCFFSRGKNARSGSRDGDGAIARQCAAAFNARHAGR